MKSFLSIEPIEAAVLKDLFSQKNVLFEEEVISEIRIVSREFTGKGFFTDFDPSNRLKIGESKYNDRWLNTHATLNSTLVVGFLVYIDSGEITTIEGFTYGDDRWPDVIHDFQIEHFDVTHIPHPKVDD